MKHAEKRREVRTERDELAAQVEALTVELAKVTESRDVAFTEMNRAREAMKRGIIPIETQLKTLANQRDNAIAEVEALHARVAELTEALKWACGEAKGRLPDWFHALLKVEPPCGIGPETVAKVRDILEAKGHSNECRLLVLTSNDVCDCGLDNALALLSVPKSAGVAVHVCDHRCSGDNGHHAWPSPVPK